MKLIPLLHLWKIVKCDNLPKKVMMSRRRWSCIDIPDLHFSYKMAMSVNVIFPLQLIYVANQKAGANALKKTLITTS